MLVCELFAILTRVTSDGEHFQIAHAHLLMTCCLQSARRLLFLPHKQASAYRLAFQLPVESSGSNAGPWDSGVT